MLALAPSQAPTPGCSDKPNDWMRLPGKDNHTANAINRFTDTHAPAGSAVNVTNHIAGIDAVSTTIDDDMWEYIDDDIPIQHNDAAIIIDKLISIATAPINATSRATDAAMLRSLCFWHGSGSAVSVSTEPNAIRPLPEKLAKAPEIQTVAEATKIVNLSSASTQTAPAEVAQTSEVGSSPQAENVPTTRLMTTPARGSDGGITGNNGFAEDNGSAGGSGITGNSGFAEDSGVAGQGGSGSVSVIKQVETPQVQAIEKVVEIPKDSQKYHEMKAEDRKWKAHDKLFSSRPPDAPPKSEAMSSSDESETEIYSKRWDKMFLSRPAWAPAKSTPQVATPGTHLHGAAASSEKHNANSPPAGIVATDGGNSSTSPPPGLVSPATSSARAFYNAFSGKANPRSGRTEKMPRLLPPAAVVTGMVPVEPQSASVLVPKTLSFEDIANSGSDNDVDTFDSKVKKDEDYSDDELQSVIKPDYKFKGVVSAVGTVQTYSDRRGFGFIKPDTGEADLLFRTNNIREGTTLVKGSRVEFDLQPSMHRGVSKPIANDVKEVVTDTFDPDAGDNSWHDHTWKDSHWVDAAWHETDWQEGHWPEDHGDEGHESAEWQDGAGGEGHESAEQHDGAGDEGLEDAGDGGHDDAEYYDDHVGNWQ